MDTSLNGPAMTTPAAYGDTPLPRKVGMRTMVPASWCGLSVELTLTRERSVKGVLADWCPVGLVVTDVQGAKRIYSWEAVEILELIEDGR
jgi:hypothetical protein